MKMKQVQITFKFALWQRDNCLKEVERFKRSYETFHDEKDEKYYFQLGRLEEKLRMWQDICTLLCPEHDFETIKEDEYGHKKEKCKVCGVVIDDPWFDEYCIAEKYMQTCSTCQYLEKGGGDWVPYGMGSTQLPVYEYCTHPNLENATDKEIEKWEEKYMDNPTCPYWEGKESGVNSSFSGKISDVRVYNRVLSSKEINMIYKLTNRPK